MNTGKFGVSVLSTVISTLLVTLVLAVLSAVLDYGPLALKTEVEALEEELEEEVKKLEDVVIELSKCVDNPQYVTTNDLEQPSISYDCYTRVLEFLR